MSLEDVITEQAEKYGGLVGPESAAMIARSIPKVILELPGSTLKALITAGFSQGEYAHFLKAAPAQPKAAPAKAAEQATATDQGGDLMEQIARKIAHQQATQERAGMCTTPGLRAKRDVK